MESNELERLAQRRIAVFADHPDGESLASDRGSPVLILNVQKEDEKKGKI